MSRSGDNIEPRSSISSGTTAKTVFLIRHAESDENRRIAALSRSWQKLKGFSLPKASDLSTSTELLNVSAQVDSNVSDIGARQIAHMGEKLRKDNFVESTGIELVIHSPLLRARQTSEGMLGCMTESGDGIEGKRVSSVSRVLETDLLLEKKPAEWTPLYHNQFLQRISDFETWLGKQPEQIIAIVGHSQYFKAMLGLDEKFGNCEVWKINFGAQPSLENTSASGDGETPSGEALRSAASSWWGLQKVYGCEIESSPKLV